MKTFNDLEFKSFGSHEEEHYFMIRGCIMFDNGYGISVVRFKNPYSKGYGSYTSNENEWEVAVIYGDEKKWDITYNTGIADDVIGYLSEGEVNWIMIQVQELEP